MVWYINQSELIKGGRSLHFANYGNETGGLMRITFAWFPPAWTKEELINGLIKLGWAEDHLALTQMTVAAIGCYLKTYVTDLDIASKLHWDLRRVLVTKGSTMLDFPEVGESRRDPLHVAAQLEASIKEAIKVAKKITRSKEAAKIRRGLRTALDNYHN